MVLVLLFLLLAACSGGGGPSPSSSPAPRQPAPATTAPAENSSTPFLAVGDIASCASQGDEATAALLDVRPGVVAALGDIVYERGTTENFARCYEPSWGRHKERTRPAVGNHEYVAGKADAYFSYFGTAAGTPGQGWYSYEAGPWHVVVLNSNCDIVDCRADSSQAQWLRSDLEVHPTRCTLAYWHHARFSSGLHGPTVAMADLFAILHAAGADVVLAGHDHHYERFSPLDPTGAIDAGGGVRVFVVGTGGRSLYPIARLLAGSEVRQAVTYGILVLHLRATDYDWEFVPVAGQTFTDRGTGTCH